MTADLRTTLLDLIGTGIAAHPRSLQRTVGPSDIANQCDVCLLRALDGSKGQRPGDDGWLPTIGTAVHSWLEDVVRRSPDYLAEQKVRVGTVLDLDVVGTMDAFHLPSRTVVDWKVVGDSTLKAARSATAHGPGGRKRSYAVQVQLYALGAMNAGLDVQRVAIAYLPRTGRLSNAVVWTEPYKLHIATFAVKRAARLLTALRSTGLDAGLASVQADPHCYQCSTTGPRTGSALAGAVLDGPATPNPADLSSAVL